MKGRGSEQKPQSYKTTLRYLLEGRAVSVLRGIALFQFALDLSAVIVNRTSNHDSLPGQTTSRKIVTIKEISGQH
jgi:hypothetical protein